MLLCFLILLGAEPAFRREGREALSVTLWVSAHKRADLLFCLRRKKKAKTALFVRCPVSTRQEALRVLAAPVERLASEQATGPIASST
ncbi:hypothetical protein JCM12178A_09650 [Salidesulfovibrio brasiliensis]